MCCTLAWDLGLVEWSLPVFSPCGVRGTGAALKWLVVCRLWWSCPMLTALSASWSVRVSIHTVEELCGCDLWPVSSSNSVPCCAISALSKNQKDKFWVRMLQSPCCDRLQVPSLRNVKMFARVTWTVNRSYALGRFESCFRIYLCSPNKKVLSMSGPLLFSLLGERVVSYV